MARIAANLAGFAARPIPAEGLRHAAVAVMLVSEPAPSLVITRRASRLRNHAGQWALPGGRVDDGEDAVTAACREVHEELGVPLPDTGVLGVLDDYATRSGFVITPVVVDYEGAFAPVPAAAEVAEVHLIPLVDLEAVEPRFVAIPESEAPVIQIPLLGALIHAPTAAVLYQFREVGLLGRHTRVAHYEQPVFAWQ